jgi:D-arabinose 1-dehydrogenase-like Zn-dependent alcohol dehydrogenase
MIAMAIEQYGQPLRELDLPEPVPGPGEALLEVLACGVCFTDVKTSRGLMPFSDELALPHVPGHEICARVVRSDSSLFEPGAIVVVYHLWPCGLCPRCRAGIEQQCVHPRGWTGFTSPGGFQQQLVAPINRLTRVPPAIDPVHAAPLTCALGTAYRAVTTRGGVRAGSRVVVIGLGGVGILALQVANACGALVTGLDRSKRALDTTQALGLDACSSDDPDAEPRLIASTDGVGVDVVIDTVGSERTLDQALRLTRPGGCVVAVGYSMGSRMALPTADLVLDEKEVLGSRYVTRAELDRAIALVASGSVQMVIDKVVPLTSVNEVLVALEAGEIAGRAVIEVAPAP